MGRVNDVIGDFSSPSGEYTLTFDDDGKFAYAYPKRRVEMTPARRIGS
jgi:hypothetical protein